MAEGKEIEGDRTCCFTTYTDPGTSTLNKLQHSRAPSSPTTDNGVSSGLTKQEEDVSIELQRFGSALKARDSYRREATRLLRKLFKKLKKYYPNVCSIHCGGSFGKKSDILIPDLDICLVINGIQSPHYESVLTEIKTILLQHHEEFKIKKETIRGNSKFSIQFEFNGGFEADLLPATKLSPNTIHEKLRETPELAYNYNSSLVLEHLSFFDSLDEYHLQNIIRLTKFWFKSFNFGRHSLSGMCTIMELIAIAATQTEYENCTVNQFKFSTLRAFTGVMDIIAGGLDSLKVVFEKIPGESNKWKRVPVEDLNLEENENLLVPRVVGTREIWERRRFIILPGNPFCDLLNVHFRNGKDLPIKLRKFAQVTRARVQSLVDRNDPSLWWKEETLPRVDFLRFFEPAQPGNFRALFENVPDYFKISTVYAKHMYSDTYNQEFSPIVEITKKDQSVQMSKKDSAAVNALKWQLIRIIHCTMQDIGYRDCDTMTPIEERIIHFIKSHFSNSVNSKSLENSDIEDMDLIISITYDDRYCHDENEDPVLHCGIGWKNWSQITAKNVAKSEIEEMVDDDDDDSWSLLSYDSTEFEEAKTEFSGVNETNNLDTLSKSMCSNPLVYFISKQVNRLDITEQLNNSFVPYAASDLDYCGLTETEVAVEREFRRFGNNLELNPTDLFNPKSIQLFHDIFNQLEESCPDKFSCLFFDGYFQKYTQVLVPNVEVYLVVRDHDVSDNQTVLEKIKNIFLGHSEKLFITSVQKNANTSLQFELSYDIKVSFSIASDLNLNEIPNLLRENPEMAYYYNTSLAHEYQSFLLSLQENLDEKLLFFLLVRLVKFWWKSLNFGRKSPMTLWSILEVICVAAAQQELKENCEDIGLTFSVLRAFSNVLQMVLHLDTLKLVFERDSKAKQKSRRVENLLVSKNLVPSVIGTREILKRERFVICPGNPFYDLAYPIFQHGNFIWRKIQKFAKVTEDRLQKLLQGQEAMDFSGLWHPVKRGRVQFNYFFSAQFKDFAASFENVPDGITVETTLKDTIYLQHDFSRIIKVRTRDNRVLGKNDLAAVNELKLQIIAIIQSMMSDTGYDADFCCHDRINWEVGEFIRSNLIAENTKCLNSKSIDEMDLIISIAYNDRLFEDEIPVLECGLYWEKWSQITKITKAVI